MKKPGKRLQDHMLLLNKALFWHYIAGYLHIHEIAKEIVVIGPGLRKSTLCEQLAAYYPDYVGA